MAIDVPISVRRATAALLLVLVVPTLATVATLNEEAPLVAGQESPRQVVADRPVQVEDVEATQRARDQARRSVQDVVVEDPEARVATITEINALFSSVRAARTPTGSGAAGVDDGSVPATEDQVAELQEAAPFLDDEALTLLIELSDLELEQLQEDVSSVASQLLRPGIEEGELETVLTRDLPFELSLRSPWPDGVEEQVAAPIVRALLRPTVLVDTEETARQQQAAVDAVDPVVQRWNEGDVVVEQGDVVSPVQFQALELLGEAGSDPGIAFVRALLAMLLVVALSALYLQRSQPSLWDDPGRLFVIALTVVVAAVLLFAAEGLVDALGTEWWFAFPIGGLVLLIAVLTNVQVGLASVFPMATLALLFAPSVPALAILVAAVVVFAAPMVERISTRVGLRKASVRVAAAAPVMAVVVALVFGPRDQLLTVVVAAAIAGIANVGLLQGLLPAFENVFKLATVTALLDLADRNHPLLRELEQKAMGSYNHSVMVASLAERCCREIRANHLLAQVAGLYHDIGKVRQPVFFIENQRGIANPHDQLTPRMSAVIIQNHVVDGVEMATEHRLPPDVVDCIASHHGTMRVGYFYRLAVDAADGDESRVDESHFRYKGHTPRSKEAAVLLLADCTEATTRAMAMTRGTLPTDLIEKTVDKLARERLDDGQFDDCQLTFVEFQTVRDTLVEALTGIYHPRIGYPAGTNPNPSPD